jgi:hypothetical protein
MCTEQITVKECLFHETPEFISLIELLSWQCEHQTTSEIDSTCTMVLLRGQSQLSKRE